ncbi:MAG: hypothetical protein IKU42_07870 [Oscillospiraceae bacterium]|nr:hypothetical protein [Oscillospiraceae bacterium]
MKIKLYLWDQILFLLCGIIIAICFNIIVGHLAIFSLILESLTILCWGLLCKRLLVFPFDLFFEKKYEEVYFSKQSKFDEYEFFRNKYSCLWTFYDSHNKKTELLVPFSESKEKILSIGCPEKNRKIRITYYKFSKILYSWEYV